MSVFTKAISASPFLCQGAQVSIIVNNEELMSGLSVKRLPYVYHRALFGLHKCEHPSRHGLHAYAASVVYEQGHPEATTQGPKRRGRPRKYNIDNGQAPAAKSQVPNVQESQEETSFVTQTREGHLFKYTEATPEVVFQQFDDELGVSAAVIKHLADMSRESIRAHGWFTIALSGGSLVKVLKNLADEPGLEWTKWHVFWVDEHVVPLTDEDSNYKLAVGTFLSKTKIPKDQIHSIKYAKDAHVVAKRYDQLMRGLAKMEVLSLDASRAFPRFDMILLGIGPDGHVASLFPNTLALAEEKEWIVAVLRSPKPPPERITMTLPCINAAAHVAFVVVGSSKAEVTQRVLERPALPGSLPAQMVRPTDGVLFWFVDKAAAASLSVEAWADPKRFPAVKFNPTNK